MVSNASNVINGSFSAGGVTFVTFSSDINGSVSSVNTGSVNSGSGGSNRPTIVVPARQAAAAWASYYYGHKSSGTRWIPEIVATDLRPRFVLDADNDDDREEEKETVSPDSEAIYRQEQSTKKLANLGFVLVNEAATRLEEMMIS
jgi:hypothetical protein